MNRGRSPTCRIAALILIATSSMRSSLAQNYTQISGSILDGSGASVPSAAVNAVDEETGFRHSAVSQPDGSYAVSSLQPGIYKITVRKAGFRTMIRFGVRVSESRPARVDFKLVVGSVQETITVEGSAAMLNTQDASVGTLTGREEIERLPLGGRGLLSLLELSPGVVVTPATRGEAGQFTVNGQRPNTHYFTVDGVSANSGVSGGGVPAQATGGSLPGTTAFGSLDSLVQLDALQEARVQTSTTAPQFGRLPGAQVALTSRSGSNEFHGSLLFGLRNEKLDANDWFANRHGDERAALRLQDSAATLGGPIWRDRTFFFLSYEGLRLLQPFVWRAPVPSLAARESSLDWAQPLLGLFPAPNGPGLGNGLNEWTGSTTRPSRLDTGSLRLDHAISSRLTAFGRYSESPSETEFGSGSVNHLDLSSRSITLGLDARGTPNLVFDLRLNSSSTESRSVWRPDGPLAAPACFIEPVTSFFLHSAGVCDYLVRFSIAGVGQVVSGSEGRWRQSQFQVVQTAGLNRGSHSMRFGADYRRLAPMRNDATGALNLLADTVDSLNGSSNYWSAGSAPRHTTAVVEEVSLFAQDTFRITPRLTATYGVRWEFSPAPSSDTTAGFLDVEEASLVALRRSIWRSTSVNFAPRFGVAYQPTSGGRTVIRAGAGLYYDSSLSLATDLVNDGPLSVTGYTSPRHAPLSTTTLSFGFLPDLRLPLVTQWNASFEHAFDSRDVVSLGYAGSSGRSLIRREVGGAGSSERAWLALATNRGSSDYHAFEAQYRRRLARGIQVLASYAFSHSIDNSSADGGLYWAGSGSPASGDRASSDFNVRHALTAGFTYEFPRGGSPGLLRGWGLDGMFRARTGFPINVLTAEQFQGVTFQNIFRPDLVSGQPVWITDGSAPGGRRINRDAFRTVPSGMQGNLGRNALNGFGMSQFDLAVQRELFAGERRSIQFRIEAFNAFNHPNFADPVRFLASPFFGQSSSMLNLMLGTGSPGSGLAPVFQAGGSRSLRVVVRLKF